MMETSATSWRSLKHVVRLTGITDLSETECAYGLVEPLRVRPKTPAELEASLQKVQASNANGVLVSHSAMARPEGLATIQRIQESGLVPVIAVPLSLEFEAGEESLLSIVHWARTAGCHLCYIAHDNSDLTPTALTLLDESRDDYHLCAVVTRWLDLESFYDALPASTRERLHLYIPYESGPSEALTAAVGSFDSSEFFDTAEIFLQIEKLRARRPGFTPRPPLGLEVWDPSIPDSTSLEPMAAEVVTKNLAASRISLSMVIAVTGDRERFQQELKALALAPQSQHAIELILVDDGSKSEQEALAKLIEESSLPITHVKIQHEDDEGMVRSPRALLWNLGARHARGAILHFLENELTTSPESISAILKRHERGEALHGNAQDVSLSVTASEFKTCGGFARVPSWHGCEVAELGLRIRASGNKLDNSFNSLLANSNAKILFRHHISAESVVSLRRLVNK